MTAQSPRPFSTFGLKPFLWANAEELKQIQKRYFQLSRDFHPDRMGQLSESERQIREATSSKINLDYAKLKDPLKLAESVVTGASLGAHNVNAQHPQSGVPPQLAAEYFEVQEVWEEKGLDSAESVASARAFLDKVKALRQAANQDLEETLKRFPFQGFGDSPAPWGESDLKKISAVLQQLRYFHSFMKDFETRFAHYAHSN